jgi:hypothetical protein
MEGRYYELWQPLLALAAWVEGHGASGLRELAQRHALATVEAGRDGQTAEADETLLEILAEKVQAGDAPTPKEILDIAKDRDKSTFDRWAPRTVSNRLESYGIRRPKKSHGHRRYRAVTSDALRKIQRNYGIDLGIPDADVPEEPPPCDPFATPTGGAAE